MNKCIWTALSACAVIFATTAQAQEIRAPMAVAIIESGDQPMHKQALEAECERSAKIDLIDSQLLEDALAAVSSAPLETNPKRQQLVAQMMREQGVETIIVVESSDTPNEYRLIAVGPSGKPQEPTAVTFDKTSSEYERQISSGLIKSFATVAPAVLAAREQRPKPTPPDLAPGEKREPAAIEARDPKTAIAASDTDTSPAPASLELREEEKALTTDEPGTPPGADTKTKTLFLSIGPAISLLDIGINEANRGIDENQASISAQNTGFSAHITARNPLWLKSLIDVEVTYGRSSILVPSATEGELPDSSSHVRNLGIRAGVHAMLIDLARLELGPRFGLAVQRDLYIGETVNMTMGYGGIVARIPLRIVLFDASLFGDFGSVNWGIGNGVFGYGFDFGASILLGRRIFLRPGLSTMYHASEEIESDVLDAQGPLTSWTFTSGISLGWSI